MDMKQAEAVANKEWSWVVAQVRAHPKTAVAGMILVGFVLGWMIHGWFS